MDGASRQCFNQKHSNPFFVAISTRFSVSVRDPAKICKKVSSSSKHSDSDVPEVSPVTSVKTKYGSKCPFGEEAIKYVCMHINF